MVDFGLDDVNIEFGQRKAPVQWIAVAPPIEPRVEAHNRSAPLLVLTLGALRDAHC